MKRVLLTGFGPRGSTLRSCSSQGTKAGSESQPRTVDVVTIRAREMSISHSGNRLRTSSIAIRPSMRANDAPRQ